MTTVNIYLTFPGNCEEAFNFYKKVFKGDFDYFSRFGEMPDGTCEKPVPESEKEKIMHVSLPISKETVLMGSDSSEAFGQVTNAGNNFSISVSTDTKDEANRLFAELSEGGQITMPMGETFWGSYFGMLIDRFQIQWMVSIELEKK